MYYISSKNTVYLCTSSTIYLDRKVSPIWSQSGRYPRVPAFIYKYCSYLSADAHHQKKGNLLQNPHLLLNVSIKYVRYAIRPDFKFKYSSVLVADSNKQYSNLRFHFIVFQYLNYLFTVHWYSQTDLLCFCLLSDPSLAYQAHSEDGLH